MNDFKKRLEILGCIAFTFFLLAYGFWGVFNTFGADLITQADAAGGFWGFNVVAGYLSFFVLVAVVIVAVVIFVSRKI